MNDDRYDPRGAADLLEQAAGLLDRALLKLDDEQVPCKCCDRAVFRDVDQHRIVDQFDEVPRKLYAATQALREQVFKKSSHGYTVSEAAHTTVTVPSSGLDPLTKEQK